MSSLFLCGCREEKPTEPDTQGIRLTDLAPVRNIPDDIDLFNVTLDVAAYDLPQENLYMLKDMQTKLSTDNVNLADKPAFIANEFSIAFGNGWSWHLIEDMFEQAGVTRIATVHLLMRRGQDDYCHIRRIRNKRKVFHYDSFRDHKGTTVENGMFVLQVMTEYLPHQRGACTLNAIPAFKFKNARSARAILTRSNKIEFPELEFSVDMGLGDFLLLGPAGYPEHTNSLSHEFFVRPGKFPKIRFYIIRCTAIND